MGIEGLEQKENIQIEVYYIQRIHKYTKINKELQQSKNMIK